MNLHNEIMNINIKSGFDYSEFESKVIAYKCGHRDARHIAAELALKYDTFIDDLENHYGKSIISHFKRNAGI